MLGEPIDAIGILSRARSLDAIVLDLTPGDEPTPLARGELVAEFKRRHLEEYPETANHAAQGNGAKRHHGLNPRGGLRSWWADLQQKAKERGRAKGFARATLMRDAGFGENIDIAVRAKVRGGRFDTVPCLTRLEAQPSADAQRSLLNSWLRPQQRCEAPSSWRCGRTDVMDTSSRFYVPDIFDADGTLVVPSVEYRRGDSRKVLPRLHNKGVRADAVVSDPPFGVKRKDSDDRTLKDDDDPRIAYWAVPHCMMLKPDRYAYLCTTSQVMQRYVWTGVCLSHRDAARVEEIVWDKQRPSGLGAPDSTLMPYTERVLILHKGKPKLRQWTNIPRHLQDDEDAAPTTFEDIEGDKLVQRDGDLVGLPVPRGKGPGDKHPTRKSVALGARFILNTTDLGDVVLDPFAGTCPFGVAAVRLGRRFVGVEYEQDFFDEGVRRLKAALARKYPEQFAASNDIALARAA